MKKIDRWRIERSVARLILAGLANVLALFFVAGWMVGAHMLGPVGEAAAAPSVAVPKRDVETAPVEGPQPLRQKETVQPERSDPLAQPPQPAARWASAWKVPSWTAPVRPASYGDLIRDAALERALSPSLVEAMARVESGFNPAAVSRKGARGLLQVLPATARRFGYRGDRLLDPEHNLAAGTTYLAWLLNRYGGNLDFALAAYNAGEGAVDTHGGIPPYRETRNYVRRVKAALLRIEPSAGQPAILGEFPPVVFDQRLEDNWKALGFAAGSVLGPALPDVSLEKAGEGGAIGVPVEVGEGEEGGHGPFP